MHKLLVMFSLATLTACVGEDPGTARSQKSQSNATKSSSDKKTTSGGTTPSGTTMTAGIPKKAQPTPSTSGTTTNTGTSTTTIAPTNLAGISLLTGQVKAADGITPVVGATVYKVKGSEKIKLQKFDEDGDGDSSERSEKECKTDNKGRFACEVEDEEGKVKFKVEKEKVANKEFEAEVRQDWTTQLDERLTRVDQRDIGSRWLVVPGKYDGVQLLLSQLKGCTLNGNPKIPASLRRSQSCDDAQLRVLDDGDIDVFFADLNKLTPFQFIFINCARDMRRHANVLKQYVAQGGHIYFSDWASLGLDAAFPGNVEFGDIDTKRGYSHATVLNDGLKQFLGDCNINVIFDLGAWVPVTRVSSNVKTYIKADTYELGGTFNAPITVGWKERGQGCVFFTSYHIEGASTGSNQEKSLKYLLLNIDTVCLQ